MISLVAKKLQKKEQTYKNSSLTKNIDIFIDVLTKQRIEYEPLHF